MPSGGIWEEEQRSILSSCLMLWLLPSCLLSFILLAEDWPSQEKKDHKELIATCSSYVGSVKSQQISKSFSDWKSIWLVQFSWCFLSTYLFFNSVNKYSSVTYSVPGSVLGAIVDTIRWEGNSYLVGRKGKGIQKQWKPIIRKGMWLWNSINKWHWGQEEGGQKREIRFRSLTKVAS